MKNDKRVTLYNIMLPLWLLIFWPSYLWLFLIPLNYLIDRIVLRWSLGNMPEKGAFCRKHTWKICLAGFLCDFIGVCILFGSFMLMVLAEEGSSAGELIEKVSAGVGFNPFSHILSFLIVALAVAVSGVLIYRIDKAILNKTGLDPAQAKRSALRLALITAPYLYFFPSSLYYNSSLFTL